MQRHTVLLAAALALVLGSSLTACSAARRPAPVASKPSPASQPQGGYFPKQAFAGKMAMASLANGPATCSTPDQLRATVSAPVHLPGQVAGPAEGYWVGGSTDGTQRVFEGRYPKLHVRLLVALSGADPAEVNSRLANPPTVASASNASGTLMPFKDGRRGNLRPGSVAGNTALIIDPGTAVSEVDGEIAVPARIVWFDGTTRYDLSSYEATVPQLQAIADSMY